MLRFLHSIQNLNDTQLQKKVAYQIQKLERKSKKISPGAIQLGYDVGCQPLTSYYDSDENEFKTSFMLNCVFAPFVRKDTKMIYGLSWNTQNGLGCNCGNYYYMDNQDYLYDFCKYVQDQEVIDEYYFFECVSNFLHHYFGQIKQVINRDQMHQMILKPDGYFYDPVVEHSISDFKGMGNAMCSEYAIMAHNILKLFDFETYLVIGNVKLDGNTSVAHAYNLITFSEENTGKVKHAVLDFANTIDIFDTDFSIIGKRPFLGFIPRLDYHIVEQLVNGDAHFKFDEYSYFIVGDSVFQLGLGDKKRDYFIDNYIYANPDVKLSKIYEKTKEPMI